MNVGLESQIKCDYVSKVRLVARLRSPQLDENLCLESWAQVNNALQRIS